MNKLDLETTLEENCKTLPAELAQKMKRKLAKILKKERGADDKNASMDDSYLKALALVQDVAQDSAAVTKRGGSSIQNNDINNLPTENHQSINIDSRNSLNNP